MAWDFDARTAAQGADLGESTTASFLAGVYRWMALGLAVTAGVALYTASHAPLALTVARNIWPLVIAQFLAVMALSFLAQRMGGAMAAALFLAYAALTGLTLSGIFFIYTIGSIGTAFLLAAGTFGALSVYGAVTKRDLGAWRTFLFMGLIGVVLASVVQLFWSSPGFSFVLSCAVVVVFAGLTAYDTQKLRAFQLDNAGGGTGVSSLTIVGALMLYLDFINLFLALLRLFGDRRR
jgi:FtsH-binding integral membrane protein